MNQPHFPMGLTFDDVLLQPRESRVEPNAANTKTKITKKTHLNIPILSAAMDTVTGDSMAICLGKIGGLGVLHRNCDIAAQTKMVRAVKRAGLTTAAAVGPHDHERARKLQRAGADLLFVDCAHAHNLKVVASIKKMRQSIKVAIVVGNIATAEAARALAPYADAIKVGIGPGSICTTRVVAGVGVPHLTAIMEVTRALKKTKIPVIADGGIKYSGDIVKALAAGASAIMLGAALAGTKETPGEVIKIGGQLVKIYRGMGSVAAMKKGKSSDRYFQNGSKKYVPEGVEGLMPYKGHAEEIIYQMVGGLKAGMGYIGAATIPEIARRARFILITNSGLRESHPHTVSINKQAPNY